MCSVFNDLVAGRTRLVRLNSAMFHQHVNALAGGFGEVVSWGVDGVRDACRRDRGDPRRRDRAPQEQEVATRARRRATLQNVVAALLNRGRSQNAIAQDLFARALDGLLMSYDPNLRRGPHWKAHMTWWSVVAKYPSIVRVPNLGWSSRGQRRADGTVRAGVRGWLTGRGDRGARLFVLLQRLQEENPQLRRLLAKRWM
jgi:hypothetical protein